MARRQKLKVYRPPGGFHGACVAAASQKSALAAWGNDVDPFARGVAKLVEDEESARKPLANLGKVVRRSRGSAESISRRCRLLAGDLDMMRRLIDAHPGTRQSGCFDAVTQALVSLHPNADTFAP